MKKELPIKIILSRLLLKNSKGFIALISVLIISATLLTIAVTAGTSGFYARSDILHSEFKRQALSLAEACTNVALLKLRENYNYDPSNEIVPVGSDECRIESVSAPDANFNRAIRTWAQSNSSFSKVITNATIQDPAIPPISPPPACAIGITPNTINSGNSAWLSWATSTNATSFTIDQGIGSTTPTASGQLLVTPTQSTTWNGTVTGPGGSDVCSASVTVSPSLSCADTVIIVDRRKLTNLNAQRVASKALLDQYSNVSPKPQVSIGSFRGINNTPASIPSPAGLLTNAYGTNSSTGSSTGLYKLIEDVTATASGGTLGAYLGIRVAEAEFNSIRHTGNNPLMKKVLLILSDGDTGDSRELVLTEADIAKQSGQGNPNQNTEIFSIFIGDIVRFPQGHSVRATLAAAASGIATIANHQPGSLDDQPSGPAAENTDGDHFFVSPTPSEIVTIFKNIGEIVCPASVAPPGSPAPPASPPPPLPISNISIGSWEETP